VQLQFGGVGGIACLGGVCDGTASPPEFRDNAR
jgi:hypothetical protein